MKKIAIFFTHPGFEPETAVCVNIVGSCAVFNRIYSLVICIIIRFKVCTNSNLQTPEISADYSA